jgi:hypothetical protein
VNYFDQQRQRKQEEIFGLLSNCLLAISLSSRGSKAEKMAQDAADTHIAALKRINPHLWYEDFQRWAEEGAKDLG